MGISSPKDGEGSTRRRLYAVPVINDTCLIKNNKYEVNVNEVKLNVANQVNVVLEYCNNKSAIRYTNVRCGGVDYGC